MTNIFIRKIRKEDNKDIASIIRTVMPEFGASGEGFAIHDKEVDDMFQAYNGSRSAYFVCEHDSAIIGGGGIGQLIGGPSHVCELKKMYFLPVGRHRGLGKKVLEACIGAAKSLNYEQVYLETFNTMVGAMQLYEKMGFKRIDGPMGNTGHFSCDVFYLKQLP